jgi:quercetin dioxygenase-like cupin family protein
MRAFSTLVTIALLYVLLGAGGLYAQEPPLSKEKETIDILQYPLKFEKDLGISTVRIGEGVLHQVEVTIVEIPAGGKQSAHRHLAEEVIYIVSGQGYTSMWTRPGDKEQRYEWKTGDYLSPSLNVWHQHVNTSTDKPARFVSISSAPLTYNLFHNNEFLVSSDFVFEDRWKYGISQQPEYTPEGGFEGPEVVRMRAGHILPNLPDRKMARRAEDVLGITILPEGDMAGNHIMEMEVRELQGANKEVHVGYSGHRHPWETVYVMLKGKGYSILQRPNERRRRVNWQAGDMIIVEANEFHDHRTGDDSPGWSNLQVKPSGYFHGVGNVGGTDNTPVPEEFR